VQIEDNGKGFDLNEVKGNVGLQSMRSRAEILGANLMIDSQPHIGTVITLSMSLSVAK